MNITENLNPVSEQEQERIHIGKTLFHYVTMLPDGRFPRDNNGVLDILSVGCSFGIDSKPIIDVFTESRYKGIDIDLNSIKMARRYNSDVSLFGRAEFVEEDATKIDPSEEGKYGLIVVRHPQVFGDMLEAIVYSISALEHRTFSDVRTRIVPNWKQIFESSFQKLAPDGYMFVTTGNKGEREAVAAIFEDNNIETIINEKNTASSFKPSYFIGEDINDQYVIIGRKI